MNYELAFVIGIAGALVALVFAFVKSRQVMKFPEGTDAMKKIAAAIRRGANAYLKRQFRTVAIFYVVMVAILTVVVLLGYMSPFIPVAFLVGGILTQLSAFIGMKIATYANVRTANAARDGLNQGLKVAFSSGTVMGFTVIGLALLDVSLWFLVLRFVFELEAVAIAENMVMFGVGVGAFALFARVGGGIFTKAADVGADLVGKVEAGIPEDDPRNPAVIADNVGDNVGDVAGMGADLYESYIKALHAAIALGVAAFVGHDLQWASMFLPVALGVVGVLAALIATFFVRTKENADQKQLLNTLRTGEYGSAILAAIGFAPVTFLIMGRGYWLGLYIAILTGLVAGCLIAYFTEYFTSAHYKPTKLLAKSSETGSATLIIAGISLGMKSTIAPILIVSGAVIISFLAGGGILGVDGTEYTFSRGLYGVGIAAVGMLSTLGMTLACDAYGPVADNAGGIAQMADLGEEVRDRTDALDSLGNTTAATGKGFAIGSAALTSLALLVSYINLAYNHVGEMYLSIRNPSILVGMFIGAMLIFVFAAMTMSAVQRSAGSIVQEVRRQFKEITGIMDGTAEP
ncbi:MAG: sodium-translocating pyrophosphatase, partial [Oscillospiraceae bacterium]|nr:sodium-translocating pyrophosphatase [Oscillospiraceae bacterium]